jgi:hypothetical protein
VRPDRQRLHERASTIVRALVHRYGAAIPDDAETIIRYYLSCENACDRAAEDVLRLERLLSGPPRS